MSFGGRWLFLMRNGEFYVVILWALWKHLSIGSSRAHFGDGLRDTGSRNVMNLNFITILCSITVLLWFTYYQFASCQLVITRNYFRRSAVGSAYLGPIALSWAFPYWRHRHFDCNPVGWNPSAIRSDLIYFSCKLFNIPRIDLYVSVYCSIIRT